MRSDGVGLEISASLLAEVESHAVEALPEECCGILVGREGSIETVKSATVESVWRTANVDPGDRSRGFSIRPEELLRVHKHARGCRQEVIGYYHSHPGASAIPSGRDLAAAEPGVSYLILSLIDREVTECRSWRLRSDGSCFDEESLI